MKNRHTADPFILPEIRQPKCNFEFVGLQSVYSHYPLIVHHPVDTYT